MANPHQPAYPSLPLFPARRRVLVVSWKWGQNEGSPRRGSVCFFAHLEAGTEWALVKICCSLPFQGPRLLFFPPFHPKITQFKRYKPPLASGKCQWPFSSSPGPFSLLHPCSLLFHSRALPGPHSNGIESHKGILEYFPIGLKARRAAFGSADSANTCTACVSKVMKKADGVRSG